MAQHICPVVAAESWACQCRAKAEKAAAAEAARMTTDMETNIEEAEHMVLPSGQEVEVAGQGAPDLPQISRRIKETARLLETFKVRLAHTMHTQLVSLCAHVVCWEAKLAGHGAFVPDLQQGDSPDGLRCSILFAAACRDVIAICTPQFWLHSVPKCMS